MRNRDYYRYMNSGETSEERMKKFHEHKRRSRAFFGIALALGGLFYMLKEMDIIRFSINFTWPYILIIVGLFLGIKSKFHNAAWWILILIGGAYLVPVFEITKDHYSNELAWPALFVVVGLAIALHPKRDRCKPSFKRKLDTTINTADKINVDVTFGGRKEVVTSKEFAGGVTSVTFGGCEMNLSQADFTTPSVVLDFHISFGGVELIVPSHWELQNEISPTFGSVEDERTIQTAATAENKKILILRGSCSFGSIEIKSY